MQLERFMNDNGFTYCPLNPLEAKLQCNSLRIHKTDMSNAHRIPLLIFPLNCKGPEELFLQLKSLSRFYSELNDVTVIRNRMHKVIQQTFPEMERNFTTKSELFLNIVQCFLTLI
ncbi:hypothetical protein [Cytobacillus firmus]|uniref:hypothetical protein n=1 Tax=Cytobacillus TaxID=2675230 RepID=UPI003001D199